jgi:hypothetical protein
VRFGELDWRFLLRTHGHDRREWAGIRSERPRTGWPTTRLAFVTHPVSFL